MSSSTTLAQPLQLPGYTLGETLYQGSRTTVYQALAASTQQPVVVKVLSQEHPSFAELLQFRNQYEITKNLPIVGIVPPLSLEPYGNGYALVMEAFEGIDLRQYSQHNTLSITDILSIGIQLADILHELHQHQVIHKDIKPANILIHPESKQIKLIDFSIASLLPKETQALQSPNLLEGTLAYLAPEQTGRMNRSIDYRTDFYALGITLYQLLTGTLPFISDNPLELMHCHLAKQPVSVAQVKPEVPAPVAAIVAKLMAKNAEDRYQSALGLKIDLERCLTEWEKQGHISDFALGERDLSDRFLIPEKLYGRAVEVQTLLDTFERVAQGTSELMLVAGFSGIGKTAVINEVHKPIVKNRGYFIKGKFDQFNRNIPFSAFVQAFRHLMGQILSASNTALDQWKTQILAAVGPNGQVLIDVIPELERVIGEQPAVPELSGSAAQNRFNLLFEQFIAVFTTQEHPLVIFLDDLQWADSASLNLMKVLMGDRDRGYLLLLGAYRDNEVFPAHPLMLSLADLAKQKATISTITLAPLSIHHINQLVAETLSCSAETAQPLTELVYQKTQGNPFFSTQFLTGLHEDGLIAFNPSLGYWECDLVKVHDAALTDDVVEFMAGRLQKLPAGTQAVLKLAACIGNQFDLETLAIVQGASSEAVASELWRALQEGIILPISESYKFFQGELNSTEANTIAVDYRFLHDRVQQAAYSLIPEDRKQETHLKIGRLLLKCIPETEREETIFDIVNQLNRGHNIIEGKQEKVDLAYLNLIAGKKAKLSTAFTTALEYGEVGIQLLPPTQWQEYYDLTLNLHQMVAEAAYSGGEFDVAKKITESALKFARSSVEKTRFYQIKIDIYVAKSNCFEAIEAGREILKLLGVELPKSVTPEEIQQIFSELAAAMPEGGTEALLALPTTTNPSVIAAMQTLVKLATPIFTTSPELFPLLAANMIKQTLKYGTTSISAVGYSHYSMLLVSIFNDLEAAYQFGELALQLIPRFNDRAMDTNVFCIAAAATHHWQLPLKQMLPFYQQGAQAGLEAGDIHTAGWNYVNSAYTIYLVGTTLPEAKQLIGVRSDAIRQLKQENLLNYCEIFQQCVSNLLDSSAAPCNLTGDILNEQQLIAYAQKNQDTIALFFLYACKLQLCYLFGHYDRALTYANLAIEHIAMAGFYAVAPAMYFYSTLTRLALYASSADNQAEFEKISTSSEKIRHWSSHCPANFQHKYDLLKAEEYRVFGHKTEAIEMYDLAIAGAKENEYIQEEALANELAAKFYLTWGREKVAAVYMQDAYYCYSRWGAKAKVADLETRYPELLRPILQPPIRSGDVLTTLMTITAPPPSSHASTRHNSSSTRLNETLDFASILKASQALAGTIQLDDLLRQLTQIILQNSGGDRCALILPNEAGEWQVQAIATAETTQLYAEPLNTHPQLPVKLIHYVKNAQEIVAINKLETDLPVLDDYLNQQQPKSVLALPILNQGRCLGILALENRLTSGVFIEERILVLNFLCTQAAISLENARLYQRVQQSLIDLQNAQLQMVQSEKMSALGGLVAGVAHEINNPVGCILGNVGATQDYISDLLGLLDRYAEQFPKPGPDIEDELEAVDLDYVREDLPKLIRAMKDSGDRITSISKSLRTFSRADTETTQAFNLHEGLDSTVLILRHRLKANEQRPEIEVVTDYGKIPEVYCFPGQINQVFMNILANAIDALDDASQRHRIADKKAYPAYSHRITIRTALENERVTVVIADNGPGIPEAIKAKIFDHLFTTKEVGKGTGLGLAIAHQIVVNTHGGTLDVQSAVSQGTEFSISLPLN